MPWTSDSKNFTPEQVLELDAINDLVDARYLRGTVITKPDGSVHCTSTNGPTLAGRVFAEEQQAILDKTSFWGRIKSGAVVAVGWFLGWLSGIISALIIWYITK